MFAEPKNICGSTNIYLGACQAKNKSRISLEINKYEYLRGMFAQRKYLNIFPSDWVVGHFFVFHETHRTSISSNILGFYQKKCLSKKLICKVKSGKWRKKQVSGRVTQAGQAVGGVWTTRKSQLWCWKNGVFMSDQCQNWHLGHYRDYQGTELRPLRHAVVIIGFGTDLTTGLSFWKVKNS